MPFNIATLAVDETADLELNDPNDLPLVGDAGARCTITLYSPGSEAFAKAEAKRQNRLLDRLKRKGKVEMPAEEQRAEQADFLSAITVSFNGFEYPPAGKATGADLFRALYNDRSVGFITDQVQRFVGDWGNFTGKSAKD